MSTVLIVDGVEAIPIDVTLSFSSQRSATTADHPIELGAFVSDHVFINNATMELSGIISYNKIPDINIGPSYSESNPLESSTDKPKDGASKLISLFNTRTLLTVVSDLEVFGQCVIKTLTIPRNAQIGNDLHFSMTLEQLRIVGTQSSAISLELFDNYYSAARKGTKTPANDKNPDNSPSLLSSFNAIADQMLSLDIRQFLP